MQYEPKWPRTVAGKDYRLPLDDRRIEAIAKRADHLYRAVPLSDDERGRLIKLYAGLKKTEPALGRHYGGKPFFETAARPAQPWSEGCPGSVFEHNVGFVLRVSEFVSHLEAKHGLKVRR